MLGVNKGDECLVDHIRSFPLRDMSCQGDSDELRSLYSLVELFAYGDWEHPILFSPEDQRRVRDRTGVV